MKEPIFIKEIVECFYQFVKAHTTSAGCLMAFIMSLARAKFINSDEPIIHNLSDAVICGFLTLSATPLLGRLGLNEDFAIFIGAMTGFIGAEQIRKFLFDFVGKKINGGQK